METCSVVRKNLAIAVACGTSVVTPSAARLAAASQQAAVVSLQTGFV